MFYCETIVNDNWTYRFDLSYCTENQFNILNTSKTFTLIDCWLIQKPLLTLFYLLLCHKSLLIDWLSITQCIHIIHTSVAEWVVSGKRNVLLFCSYEHVNFGRRTSIFRHNKLNTLETIQYTLKWLDFCGKDIGHDQFYYFAEKNYLYFWSIIHNL